MCVLLDTLKPTKLIKYPALLSYHSDLTIYFYLSISQLFCQAYVTSLTDIGSHTRIYYM